MTRSQPQVVEALGAQPVVCDVYDAEPLRRAVERFAPDLVLHQLTDLPDALDQLAAAREANRRMRTEGTLNLVTAAGDVKLLAQSTAFPATVEEHERLVLDAGGVVLRYGYLYGPGTWYEGDELPPPPRVQVDEAVRQTLAALDAPRATTLEIVDPG
jgi:hypothetical protein